MGLETGTYVSDLVSSNPTGSDVRSQGDDHLRLIKAVLQATFPNASRPWYAPRAVAKTANYTVLSTDLQRTITTDPTGGSITLTLPTLASSDDGWWCRVIRITGGANLVTLSATINGATNLVLSSQYQAVTVFWDGSAWYVEDDVTKILYVDAGAAVGPAVKLFRDSSSPAVSDLIAALDWYGRDSAANEQLYGRLGMQITSPTSTTEAAVWYLQQVIAGTLTTILSSTATAINIALGLDITGDVTVNTNKLIVTAASGSLASAGTITATGALSGATAAGAMLAVKADQGTGASPGASTSKVVQPGVQQYHPSATKAWANFTTGASPSINAGYGVSSVSRNATGIYVINWSTAFASANYAVQVSADRSSSTGGYIATYSIVSTSQCIVVVVNDANGAVNPNSVSIAAWGDQ